MNGRKNSITQKLKAYLLKTFSESDIGMIDCGISAPFLQVRHSKDGELLEITNFDEKTGKHYSGWYFMPLTFKGFERRVTFNKMKLTQSLNN